MGSSTVKANIIINLGSAKSVNCIILPFCNLTSAATITVKYYASAPSTNSADPPVMTGTPTATLANTVLCSPWNTLNIPDWGTLVNSSNSYAYGGGTYAVVYFTSTSVQHLSLEITDTRTGADKYIEVSRILVGTYYAPVYNTSFGIEHEYKDLTDNVRTEAGDLLSSRMPRYNTLKFDLRAMDQTDRQEFSKLLITNGKSRAIFISIFPENGSTTVLREQERVHMIYGKLVDPPTIQYFAPGLYTTSINIEEV
jgi:hypothetical protein